MGQAFVGDGIAALVVLAVRIWRSKQIMLVATVCRSASLVVEIERKALRTVIKCEGQELNRLISAIRLHRATVT